MNVAIIPARGGSKRIPRKNIRSFAGRPIIAWSIEAARQSACIDRIIVSTDDDEIARVASDLGAEVPFRRPLELADDHSGTLPVIRHAAEWLLASGESIENLCCIHATAPFIDAQELRAALQILQSESCDYVFPVTTFPAPIQRALRIDDDGRVGMFQPEYFHSRSQDLEEAYHDAGQFWWGRAGAWLQEEPVYTSAARPIRIPRHRVQDIDTEEDWHYAELLFEALKRKNP